MVPYYILCQCEIFQILIDEKSFIECTNSAINVPLTFNALKRIVEYLKYKHEYKKTNGEVKDFEVAGGEVLELLEASAFLRI